MDADGAEFIDYDKITCTTGSERHQNKGYARLSCDSNLLKSKATLEYNLKKGTYYVRAVGEAYSYVHGKTSISFSYPQDEDAKITSFTVTLKKGDTLQLGTILSGDGDVTWSTSKKSVATVTSKGKVTAKGKGKAVTTAKTGNSSMKITINVT